MKHLIFGITLTLWLGVGASFSQFAVARWATNSLQTLG
jgi:hypothetical protein